MAPARDKVFFNKNIESSRYNKVSNSILDKLNMKTEMKLEPEKNEIEKPEVKIDLEKLDGEKILIKEDGKSDITKQNVATTSQVHLARYKFIKPKEDISPTINKIK